MPIATISNFVMNFGSFVIVVVFIGGGSLTHEKQLKMFFFALFCVVAMTTAAISNFVMNFGSFIIVVVVIRGRGGAGSSKF